MVKEREGYKVWIREEERVREREWARNNGMSERERERESKREGMRAKERERINERE